MVAGRQTSVADYVLDQEMVVAAKIVTGQKLAVVVVVVEIENLGGACPIV